MSEVKYRIDTATKAKKMNIWEKKESDMQIKKYIYCTDNMQIQ